MEEKKTYPTAMVEITTEEYRDLITEAAENRKEAATEKERRWEAEGRERSCRAEYEYVKKETEKLMREIAELVVENKKLVNEMAKLEVELANYKEVCKNVCS